VASEQAVQVGTDLVSFTFLQGVALSTPCFEEVSPLLCVSYIAKPVSKNSRSIVCSWRHDLGASWRQQLNVKRMIPDLRDGISVCRRCVGPDISTFQVGLVVSWERMFRGWRAWDESAPGADDDDRAEYYLKAHPYIVRHALHP